ncbi:hypothetical protein ACFYE1_09605 [Kocuria sp. CPCC 205315]
MGQIESALGHPQGDADSDQGGAQRCQADIDHTGDELDDRPGDDGLRGKGLMERAHQGRGHHAEQDPGQTGDGSGDDEPVGDRCYREYLDPFVICVGVGVCGQFAPPGQGCRGMALVVVGHEVLGAGASLR